MHSSFKTLILFDFNRKKNCRKSRRLKVGRVVGLSSLHYSVPPPPLLVSYSSELWPQTLAGGWLWAGNAPALCGCCRMVFGIWGNYLCFVRQLFGRKNPRGSVDVGDWAWPQTLVGRWFELLMTPVVAMWLGSLAPPLLLFFFSLYKVWSWLKKWPRTCVLKSVAMIVSGAFCRLFVVIVDFSLPYRMHIAYRGSDIY